MIYEKAQTNISIIMGIMLIFSGIAFLLGANNLAYIIGGLGLILEAVNRIKGGIFS